MTAIRRFTVDERRARIGVRHRLAAGARADGPVQAAAGVVALHSTDPASVFVSAWARMRGGDVAAVERALYEDRGLVRVLGMRRTVFVAPAPQAGVIAAACGRDIAARERRKLLQGLAEERPGAEAWLSEVEAVLLEGLRELGEGTAGDVAAIDARLQTEIVGGSGAYTNRQKLASRLLFILAAEGRLVRTRPKGTWNSTQFRWAVLDSWSPAAVPPGSTEEAQAELARRWLGAFGPATVADLRWWTGWTAGATKKALAAAGGVEVDLDGEPGIALAGDLDEAAAPEPWAALLPALDPTTMGWKERGFYLGAHAGQLFDRNGNASPTVWCDGRIVGGWAVRPDGELVHTLLEDIGADMQAAIDVEAERLRAPLGDVRLAPRARLRSPLETALLA